jgi:aryl-alcohol dehydrogenase-like predicted oxidoreductase
MGVLAWSPLAWGLLSGKYRKGQPIDLASGRPALNPDRFAVAFPVAHPAVTSVIIGPRTMAPLDDTALADPALRRRPPAKRAAVV